MFKKQLHAALFFIATSAMATMAGCANPDRLALGTSRDAALQTLGTPTARYILPGGERLQYSRQPAGQQVYNVDVDATGNVTAIQQVLDERQLAKVQVGTWRMQDVLRMFGKPAYVSRVYSFSGDIWVYRYYEPGINRLFYVYLDAAGVVKDTGMGDEPTRDPPEPRDK